MTAGFNFLEQPELPAPQVSEDQAEHLLLKHYGINARTESLGSQQDKNFLVFDSDDRPFAVLKIANPAFTATELASQDAAAQVIADAEPTLRVAVPLPNLAAAAALDSRGKPLTSTPTSVDVPPTSATSVSDAPVK